MDEIHHWVSQSGLAQEKATSLIITANSSLQSIKNMTIKKTTKNDQISERLQVQPFINTVHEEEIQQSVHLAAGDEALEASADVTLAGSNLEVTVNDARNRMLVMIEINWRQMELTSQPGGYQFRYQGHREGRRQRKGHQCKHHRRQRRWE